MAHWRHRNVPIISLLLLVLAARALVPSGFMPSGDGAAGLMLCPDGMLMPADAGHGPEAPATGRVHSGHCPYGSAPFAAPISDLPVIPQLAVAISTPGFDPSVWIARARASRSHQPRAPPA